MKKTTSILLLLIVTFIVWFYVNKQALQKPPILEPTNTVVESPLSQTKTNFIEIASHVAPVERMRQPTNAIGSLTPLSNALTTTNIEQWKAMIKGLHKSPGLSESWDMEITNRISGISIPLIANGQTNFYKARFINIDVYQDSDGKIMEIQMHSPIMNIAETRELGLQLCKMLGQDPSDFLAWCDKVGNHWLDAPLYGVGESSRHYSFQILRTYTDEKPWYINFMIIPNP